MNGIPTAVLRITECSAAVMALDLADTLRSTCAHIGCTRVDVVRLEEGLDMWIDDEGDVGEVNPLATALAASFGFDWQPYYGIALVTGVDSEGGTIGLTPDQISAVALRKIKLPAHG